MVVVVGANSDTETGAEAETDIETETDPDLASLRPRATDELDALADELSETDELLVCLDFDGTLAPIVERPEDAEILPENAAAVRELHDTDGVRTAVVSGRALDDVRERVAVGGLAYAGNHGLELQADEDETTIHPEADRHRPTVQSVADDLAVEFEAIDGALVERKGVTATVHYRLAAEERVDEIERTVQSRVEGVEGLEVTDGKQILEVRPTVEWDKGRAVEWLADSLAEDPLVVYVGDDTTDEAAFEAIDRGESIDRGVSFFVGRERESAADYRVPDPQGVGRLLAWLSEFAARDRS